MSFLLRVFWERKKKKNGVGVLSFYKGRTFSAGWATNGLNKDESRQLKRTFPPVQNNNNKKNNQTADHLLCYSSKYSSRNTFLFLKYNNWIHERERGRTLCYYYRGNKTGYRQNRRISNIRNMNGFIIFPFVYIYPHYYWALISLFRLLLDMSLVGGI